MNKLAATATVEPGGPVPHGPAGQGPAPAFAARWRALLDHGEQRLRPWLLRRRIGAIAERSAQASLVGPACIGLIQAGGVLFGSGAWAPGPAVIAIAVVAPPLITAAAAAAVTLARGHVRREVVLSHFDDALNLDDRFGAADEFLRTGAARSGFAAAAVQDAAARLREAEQARTDVADTAFAWPSPRAAAYLPAALILALIVFWVGGAPGLRNPPEEAQRTQSAEREPGASPQPVAASDSRAARSEAAGAGDPAEESAGRELSAGASPASGASSGAASDGAGGPVGDNEEGERAEDGGGDDDAAAAAARASSPQSSSDSSPGAAATSRAGASQQDDDGSQGAGAESGMKGASSGEGDQGEGGSGGEQQGGQSGGEGDQSAQQQSGNSGNSGQQAGGVPSSSSSDGQSSGDEEGAKKSRGVATMILGVPTTDRLAGAANEQGPSRRAERMGEPQADDAGDAVARTAAPRASQMGAVAHTRMDPELQAVVRNYFVRDAQAPAQPGGVQDAP